VRIDGRQPLLRVVERMMNWRSRLERHRHRRPGDLRSPRGVRAGWWLSRAAVDGGHCPVEAAQAVSPPACLRERVITSGRRWEKHGVLRTIC
jgi:hypothetical protein